VAKFVVITRQILCSTSLLLARLSYRYCSKDVSGYRRHLRSV